MAMTVTITMSITVKAIVKIVTFQNPIYWYGFCPLDPIKNFYLSLLKDYKNSEWSVATLWSLPLVPSFVLSNQVTRMIGRLDIVECSNVSNNIEIEWDPARQGPNLTSRSKWVGKPS